MPPPDHVVTAVDQSFITSVYPRTVGRNARLGSHGNGGTNSIAIITTNTGHRGWGLVEGRFGNGDEIVGQTLADLIDPERGVLKPSYLWLDFALHDLAGIALDVPVHEMLGSQGDKSTPCYDGGIYFDDIDPEESPLGLDAVIANCAADHQSGYNAFKLKIGRGNRWMDRDAGNARDIEVTRAVREAYPDSRILVDANDGYDCDGFLSYLDAVVDCNLYWVEEPFIDDAADLARLRSYLDAHSPATLIAEGETSPDVEAVVKIASEGHIDVLLMDVISFGLTPWRQLMPRLSKPGIQASPHAWGRPLKTLYAAQMAAGLGQVPMIEGVPGFTDGLDTSSYQFADSTFTVPDLPGFGLPIPNS